MECGVEHQVYILLKVVDRHGDVTAALYQFDLVVAWVVKVKSEILKSEVFLTNKITQVQNTYCSA